MKMWKRGLALLFSLLILVACLPTVLAEEAASRIAVVIQEEEISKTAGKGGALWQDFKFDEYTMTKGNENYVVQGQIKLTLSADATPIPADQVLAAIDATLNGQFILSRYAGAGSGDWGRYSRMKDCIDDAAKEFDVWMTFTLPMTAYNLDSIGEVKPEITHKIGDVVSDFSGSVTCSFKQVYLLDISDARIVARFNDKSATAEKNGAIKFAWETAEMIPFTHGIEHYSIEGKIRITLPDGVTCAPEDTEAWVKKTLCRNGKDASLIFTQDKTSNTWGWFGTLDPFITSPYTFNDWMTISIPMTTCQKSGTYYTGLQEWKFEANNYIPYTVDGSITLEMTELKLVDHSVNADGSSALPTLTVNFMGKFDQTIHTATVASAAELEALLTTLQAPALGGYTFCGWDESDAAILFDSYKGQEDPYVINAVYSTGDKAGQRQKYAVTLDPAMAVLSEVSADGQYFFDQRMELSVEGDVAYWLLDGQKLAYGQNRFTFYVTGDNTVGVVMDDGTPVTPEASVSIQQTAYSSTKIGEDYRYTLTVIAQTYLPTGSGEVSSFGVYYAATEEALEAIKNGQEAKYVKIESSKTGNNQQYMTHLLEVKPEKTRWAMAYMMVNGQATYSSTVSFVTGADGTVTL